MLAKGTRGIAIEQYVSHLGMVLGFDIRTGSVVIYRTISLNTRARGAD